MKQIVIEFDRKSGASLYMQLYAGLKKMISAGEIEKGERLPSLRALSKDLGVSITCVKMAYDQLLIEGYVDAKPQSGYYASDASGKNAGGGGPVAKGSASGEARSEAASSFFDTYTYDEPDFKYDPASFDFVKWKKCISQVINDYHGMLLFEGDPQGEKALREEIARYAYSSRGVICSPDQIVVSAGTQQLMMHLARILDKMGTELACVEHPGYLPAELIFRDRHFAVLRIPVNPDGIEIESLPTNVPSCVYVVPSNQFPTGAIMPAARRLELLSWAEKNKSYIIEDDYDSELRYFGRPLPSLQGLSESSRVIYLGSFSSTLFASLKLSYMVLPKELLRIFRGMRSDYRQTSSKLDQLTMALFMSKGYYRSHLRKIRSLYSQKLEVLLDSVRRYGDGVISASDTSSGISVTLFVKTADPYDPERDRGLAASLVRTAASRALQMAYAEGFVSPDMPGSLPLIFYYNQIPIDEIDRSVKGLFQSWKAKLEGVRERLASER